MGKIVSNFFITLDGVVESPNTFIFPYFNDEVGEAVDAGMGSAEAFLMGRQLYSEWSEYWPTSKDEPFATSINAITKYVVSSSLTEASWNNTTILSGEDLVDQVRQLKESTSGDIAMSGSATTVRWLIANGLLDELHLLVAPIGVGTGQRLFTDRVPLKLEDSRALQTGVLHLRYSPA